MRMLRSATPEPDRRRAAQPGVARTVDQVLLFGRSLRLQHRRSHVTAMTSHGVRRHVEAVRDAVQHVAAQELAVDVDELRVRADRAGAGH